jgi:hypothetical protein
VLRVACSKGTYLRVLAEDIAGALGCCAHLAALRRTVSGPFGIEAAVSLEALEAMSGAARDALLLPSTRRFPVSRGSTSMVDRAGSRGRTPGAPAARNDPNDREVPLLRPAGALSRSGRNDRRRAALGASRAHGRDALTLGAARAAARFERAGLRRISA